MPRFVIVFPGRGVQDYATPRGRLYLWWRSTLISLSESSPRRATFPLDRVTYHEAHDSRHPPTSGCRPAGLHYPLCGYLVVVCGHIDHGLLVLIPTWMAGMHTQDRLARESRPAEPFRNSIRNLRFRA